ncbi:DUF3324 domain-containing protein [Lactobacillus sp. ESL0677]|uniref:DUF3324 domain-containing protein n=1 Tax=Lactobacillus sp. ESL0677 TaxID=2983208 RepID=UPI0023F82838|nr:DUF3324 domain-containing protein [Lactobacillus sp. ESL0677]WEV37206.1 DUF3324 domain-containing protein [Lactobacillus sp. ESL0677]
MNFTSERKRLGFILVAAALFLFSLFGGRQTVNAAESFSVRVAGSNSSYIERQVKPKQNLRVKLIFVNNSAKVQTVNVSPNQAITGDNGLVQYNLANPGKRYFGQNNFRQMTSGPHRVRLAAHAQVSKTYVVKVPRKAFKGVLAGSFYVSQITKPQKDKKAAGQKAVMGYRNVYSYAIPLILRESKQVVHTKLAMPKVMTKVDRSNPFIIVRLANETPTMFGQLVVTTKVVNPRTKKSVFAQTKKNLAMAPLSYFDNHVLLNKKLSSGTYDLLVIAQSGTRQWQFKQKVEIDAKLAQAASQKDRSPKDHKIWLWLAIGAAVIVILLMLSGMYCLGKRHGKN